MICVRRPVLALPMAVCALVLAGCAPYAPAPIRLEAYPNTVDARRLDAKTGDAAWTGEDLLRAAVRNNAAIAEAAAKHSTALAAAKAARVRPGVTLTLTAEYSQDPKPWLYGAGSDIPLDVGGRRSERLGAADLAVTQALYDYGEAVWAVRAALARARAERLSADSERVAALRLETLRQARVDRLDQRVAAGEDDRALALAARTDLALAHRRTAEAQTRRIQADATLAQALGVPIAAVADVPLAPIVPPPPSFDVAQARRDAASSRRDVLRAVVDYDLAEGALRLEVAKQYPEIHLGPGYTWDHGIAKLPFNLGLVLPPMDLNRSAIAQAEARRAEAGRALEAVQAAALAAVDQAQVTLSATQAVEVQIRDRDLPVARRLATMAARSRQAGETDVVDDLAAQGALLETELSLLDARRTTASAVVDLEDALRAPFDPAETLLLQDITRILGAGS